MGKIGDYIFNDLYVIECLRRGFIPPEHSERIIKMNHTEGKGFYYYDNLTGERYKYTPAVVGYDCEVLLTAALVCYMVKKYNKSNGMVEEQLPIYMINDERFSQALFEKCKRTRTLPFFNKDINRDR